MLDKKCNFAKVKLMESQYADSNSHAILFNISAIKLFLLQYEACI